MAESNEKTIIQLFYEEIKQKLDRNESLTSDDSRKMHDLYQGFTGREWIFEEKTGQKKYFLLFQELYCKLKNSSELKFKNLYKKMYEIHKKEGLYEDELDEIQDACYDYVAKEGELQPEERKYYHKLNELYEISQI